MDAPPPLVARFRQVLAHIEDHPDGALDLDALSGVAAYSKYHFHRQFQAFFGLSLHRYVQGQRLRRAGEQLALQPKLRVLDAALAAGYESHEAFTRAFRQATGRTPSAFRRQPQWPAWHALWRPLRDLRRTHMQATPRLDDVRVVDFPATPLAIAEHHGDRRGDPAERGVRPVRLARPHLRDLADEGLVLVRRGRKPRVIRAHALDIGGEGRVGLDRWIHAVGRDIGGLGEEPVQPFRMGERDVDPDDPAIRPADEIDLVDLQEVEQREIVRLKKQLREAELERDILKKAISIFSKSDGKSSNS